MKLLFIHAQSKWGNDGVRSFLLISERQHNLQRLDLFTWGATGIFRMGNAPSALPLHIQAPRGLSLHQNEFDICSPNNSCVFSPRIHGKIPCVFLEE